MTSVLNSVRNCTLDSARSFVSKYYYDEQYLVHRHVRKIILDRTYRHAVSVYYSLGD